MSDEFPLSGRERRALQATFSKAHWSHVEEMLVNACRPPAVHAGPEAIERIRLAVLKLAMGDLQKIEHALSVAHGDWRDVLVWAGFGSDLSAHLHWSETHAQ